MSRRVTTDDVTRAAERRIRRTHRSRWTLALSMAVGAFVLDQVIKAVVRNNMDEAGSGIELTPFLRIDRYTNDGIAFGLFPGRQGVVATLTLIALAGIALALVSLVRQNPWGAAGAGLLVGGSLGNLVDRLRFGGVTDFIDFDHWPAFNIADSAITIGAILIIMGLMEATEEPDR
ncbi:MAG: signal peptidase II [Thermoleophilia bacterium]